MATSISEIEDVADNPREKTTETSVRELADIGTPFFLLHLELSSSKLPTVKPAAGLAGRTIGNMAIGRFGKMNTGFDQKLSSITWRCDDGVRLQKIILYERTTCTAGNAACSA